MKIFKLLEKWLKSPDDKQMNSENVGAPPMVVWESGVQIRYHHSGELFFMQDNEFFFWRVKDHLRSVPYTTPGAVQNAYDRYFGSELFKSDRRMAEECRQANVQKRQDQALYKCWNNHYDNPHTPEAKKEFAQTFVECFGGQTETSARFMGLLVAHLVSAHMLKPKDVAEFISEAQKANLCEKEVK